MSMNWHKVRATVLGLGETGLATASFLVRAGADVTVADTRAKPPQLQAFQAAFPQVPVLLGRWSEPQDMDVLIPSPGLSFSHPAISTALAHRVPVLGDIEIGLRWLATHPLLSQARVVVVTGTNGKSTVVELVGAMARGLGLSTVVAGNVGYPLLKALEDHQHQRLDVLVLELSSYQLEATWLLAVDAAAVLNITPDHLDHHGSWDSYVSAKHKAVARARVAVLNRQDPTLMPWLAELSQGRFSFGLNAAPARETWGLARDQNGVWISEGEEHLINTDELQLQGSHNWSNLMAALALGRALDWPYAPMLDAARAFTGLPHRVQLVGTVGNVRYVNDSKGTNVGATLAALEGMTTPVVAILGGDGKAQDFSPLIPALQRRARAVVVLGQDADVITATLSGQLQVPLERAHDMAQVVELASELAVAGDTVLLSPACASTDMFTNYQDRGDQFSHCVRALRKR